MTLPYRTTRRVEFHDTDAAQIAHFSAFFLYMEEVEHEYLRERGLCVVSSDSQGTVSWPRVAASCQYTSAARFEDVLDVDLSIARIGKSSVTYSFRFTHEGNEVAVGEMTSVCCRLDAGGTFGAMPIPAEFAKRLLQA